ncbi:imidazole glycerol phosphate synthase subunit HisH [Arcanobacterium bovis]|uniref:Imidazole glycerol phosphate synthase subunit HisH n=1 Tax=Arcanobacterium bovis TaxID=2529275 RepID=A0A4Q9V1T3_9ACTO|nr:imidazole glycerol phosphate synthase subunit HisH [Arcanobacterium bovis]TBW21995.1 imidazole glycerol phosphate synthase subunit HisH [Arcanobacterium bovis]
MHKVVVLDADTGNVRSVVRALEHVGASVELTAQPELVMNADGLVVPGVGAFAAVMNKIRAVRADRMIERRLAGGQAVFGICVGLQIMFDRGTEFGVHEGLAQWRGSVDKLDAPVVPHMGWSQVRPGNGSALFSGIENERFYFVHSYAVQSDPAVQMADEAEVFAPPIVSYANHYGDFVAAVENGALCATQFHPEKSADAGLHLLENWLKTL